MSVCVCGICECDMSLLTDAIRLPLSQAQGLSVLPHTGPLAHTFACAHTCARLCLWTGVLSGKQVRGLWGGG